MKYFEHPLHRLVQGVFSMCRRNQCLALTVGAFGLGLLLAGLFESTLFCGCCGICCVVVSLVMLQKK